MASMEDIAAMLRDMQTQIGELITVQRSHGAAIQSNSDKLDNMDTRLVALEQKSRTPSRSATPPAKPIEEKKTTFEDVPSPASKDSGPLSREFGDEDFFGATGLPRTPAPGKGKPTPADVPAKDAKGRRDSILLRNVRKAYDGAEHPVVHASLSSYEHIIMKKLSVSSFCKFFESALLYEQREHVRLNLPTLVDESVRNTIVSKSRGSLDDARFYALSHEELYDAMQKIIAPTDRMEFTEKLSKNTEFNFSPHFRPTPEYFQPFYDALVLYSARFLKIYEILAHKRDSDEVLPHCNTRKNNLIDLFTAKIPYEYGTRALVLLDKTKWDTIYAFFKDFNMLLDIHRDIAEQARKLRRMFGGTQYEAKKFDQKLQHLQQLRALPAGQEERDEAWHDALDALADEVEDEITDMIAALQQPGKGPFKKEPYDKSALPKDPLVCITKILYGTCTKTGCSYSHKEDLVAKKRLHYVDLIQKQISAARPSPAQREPHRVQVMDDIYDDDEEY